MSRGVHSAISRVMKSTPEKKRRRNNFLFFFRSEAFIGWVKKKRVLLTLTYSIKPR